ncbi:diguanylate cyclase (GGDEF)-like protein [Kineococcus xinjiangensis]|uniref:Diguanylate cyclase (GGDEF)-like protein n=1 Tax=Kineococcus xinjiangensis TaxID=512762 RepID=A0A2S6IGW7_9ACTN|nr:diguanylate cyclase [Kineococcus xinjiangensis]PPK93400.1 diguanylate cyclase (GGDEF)-like protein [Kineococcus xinjiangensis]
MFLWQPWALLLAAASLASLLAAQATWRRRHETSAVAALSVVMLGTCLWSGAKALGLSLASIEAQILMGVVAYPGICAVVLGFFCLARAMCDRRWTWRWNRDGLLAIAFVVLFALLATNRWHNLVSSNRRLEGDPPKLRYDPEVLFWVHTLYSYALLACALLLLLRGALRVSRAHRARFVWPVIGGLVPIAGNVLNIFVLPDLPVDPAPILFLITALICLWALTRSVTPDVLPIALPQVVAAIGDCVAVVDRRGRILEANPAADAFLRRTARRRSGPQAVPARLEGTVLQELTGPLGFEFDPSAPQERTLDLPDDGVVLDVHTSPLTDNRGTCIGWVLVARDVTAALRQQQEVLAANEALREQLDLVERLRAELAEQAVRDPLTGLFNRRKLVEMLHREVPERLAAGDPVSLLMMDVDKFKGVNDNHGHAVGDAVLIGMGRALSVGICPRELLARYGGEEFVIVLPGVGAAEARERAEEWRARCALVEVDGAAGTKVSTTMSIGLVTATAGSPVEVEHLLATADAALYEAKASGRDRVVTGRLQPAAVQPAGA